MSKIISLFPEYDVIVMGGGLAGTLTALQIAQEHKDFKVLLLEKEEVKDDQGLLPASCSSANACDKIHLGFHYFQDLETAIQCLEKSVEFAQTFPNFIVGGEDLSAPERRGYHFIMAKSNVDAIGVAKELQLHYKNLVNQDPRNQVFGHPNEFVKILNANEYDFLADTIPFYNEKGVKEDTKVILGLETAESQVDIPRLKQFLNNKIKQYPNIETRFGSEVEFVSPEAQQFGYVVHTTQKSGPYKYFGKTIVNSTWANIELLDSRSGFNLPEDKRVNRIKVSIDIELPEQLKGLHSCLFSSGPYCSITVLPNGIARLTSERVTNIAHYEPGQVPKEELKELLKSLNLDHPKGIETANTILNDCASYFIDKYQKALLKAPIKAIHVGIVKHVHLSHEYTKESIYKQSSDIHKRLFDGVESRDLGFWVNAGMKMTYTASNAIKTTKQIESDLNKINLFNDFCRKIKKELWQKKPVDINGKKLNRLLNVNYRKLILHYMTQCDFKEEEYLRFTKTITNEIMQRLSFLTSIKCGFLQKRKPEPFLESEHQRLSKQPRCY